ncbi:helix-turn-helix transcriptional regulator [Paenibacillus sp. FSL P2-0536]|uniref:helix-turn-helix domain-containing protein n=1 Tax=Paenibacillus sp. FSL P2-0536 TaxID=2921629 RepID=UPI0030FA4DC1
MELFNEYLRDLRKDKRLSQGELAEMANIKAPYLSKIETGKEPAPSEEILIRLAHVLEEDPYRMIIKAGRIPNDFKNVILRDEHVYNYLYRKVKSRPIEEGATKYE